MKNLFDRIFRRHALDAEAREEIESHIAMRAEMNEKAGMPPDEALRDARLRFGNRVATREEIYRFNGFELVDALYRDLRSGFRTLRKYPGVTALALLSLTLGIGGNTLAFTFVNAVVFHDLPYPNAERLVIPDDPFTPAECRDLRERGHGIFESLGCFVDSRPAPASLSLGDGSPAEFALGRRFTPEMGRVLGIPLQLGRWFSAEDESSVVISHRLWKTRFGGSSEVLRRRVQIDGAPYTIVGVVPDEFEFLLVSVDYWAPIRAADMEAHRDSRFLGAVGRLAPGATITQAQSLLDALMAAREEKDPRKRPVRFATMTALMRGQLLDFALLFQGTVLFVLLIACANVAGLLLTQAAAQQGQLVVRVAMGSGTWRILRQVLVHSLLLFSVGGVCGLAAGWAGVRLMTNVVLPFVVDSYGDPRGGIRRSVLEAGLDGRVFLFTFALALFCGLVSAIVPMLQVARSQPADVLRESTQNATSSFARQRLRSIFVSVQVALALLLLVGATLMIKGMKSTLAQDVGFDSGDLLSLSLRLSEGDEKARSMSAQMRENLAAIPGISSASAIAIMPPLSGVVTLPIAFDGMPSQGERAQFLPILPEYFEALGVPVVSGREFGANDRIETTPVAVINETAVRRYWPNRNPLGQQIRFQAAQLPAEPPRTVIGVVTEVSQFSMQRSRAQVYVPYSQVRGVADASLKSQLRDMTFLLRTTRTPAEMTADIGRVIGDIDRSQAVSVRTMQQTMFAATQRRIVIVAVFGLFGVIAVVLAVIGVYGVMSNMVSQRLNELGIRIAVGAEPYQIRRLIIRRGGFLIGTGLLAGIVLSLAMARMVRSLLFGASSSDPVAFGLAVLLLGGAGFLACYVPARRASRIDPIVALRHN